MNQDSHSWASFGFVEEVHESNNPSIVVRFNVSPTSKTGGSGHSGGSGNVTYTVSLDCHIYSFPDPKPTYDRWLTRVPPLCSPAKAHFVNVLPVCSFMLPRCSPLLPLCSPVFPPSHVLLFSSDCVLAILNETVQLVLDADLKGAGYGSSNRLLCYFLLLPSFSFALTLSLHS